MTSRAPEELLGTFIREVRDRGQHQGGDQALQLPSATSILTE